MPSVAELRHFLYLDDALVTEFLAQLEEGELSEYNVRTSSEAAGSAGGRLGVPFARVEGSTQATETEALAYAMRLSPSSRLQRLARLLGERDALSVEPDDLTSGGPGAFAIAECDIALTGLSKLTLGFKDLERSARFFSNVNAPAAVGLANWFSGRVRTARAELKRRREIQRWRKLRDTTRALEGGYIPVIGTSTDKRKTKVLARLRRGALRVPPPELEGRARILIKTVRVVRDDEVVDAAEVFPGAKDLTIAFRKGIQASPASGLLGELTVQAPAVVATAIAVFR